MCLGSPRPPPRLMIHEEDSQDSAYSLPTAMILYSERTQTKISIEKGCMGQRWEEAWHKLPEPCPRRGPQEAEFPLQAVVYKAHVKCCLPGKFIRDVALRVSCGGTGPIGTLCLARAKIPGSWKDSRCSTYIRVFTKTADLQ